MRISLRNSLVLLSAVLLMAVVACGGNNDERPTVPPNPTSTPRPTATPEPTATATAVSTPTPAPTPTPTPPPTPTPTPATPNAAFLAQLDLASRLDIGPNTITIIDYDRGDWPSSAYGCPLPGTVYLPVVVTGWSIKLLAQDKTYEYHTDSSGDVLVNCTENRDLERQTFNLVSAGDLRSTTKIEFRRRNIDGEFVLKSTVDDPNKIEEIVDVLDVPMLRGPAATCTEIFRLIFFTPTGNQTVGTICGGNTRLIRGDGDFWQGQDAEAPPEFSTLIGPYFADDPFPTLPS